MARLRPPGAPNPGGVFEKWTVRLLLPALVLAMGFAVLQVLVPDQRGTIFDWRAWFDGPERGMWRAETIDDADVFERKFLISIADGAVGGGRDGCNYWYHNDPDDRTGKQGITSTLAMCIETPESAAYWQVAYGSPRLELLSKDRLRINGNGHTILARRWTRQDEEAERRAYEAELDRQQEEQPALPLPNMPGGTVVPPPPDRPPPPPPLPPDRSIP